METIKIRLSGSGLVMHNGELANPFNPYTQKLKELNILKKRTGVDALETISQMAEVEFQGGLYFDEGIGPYIPAFVARAVLVSGAKMSRGGKTVQRAVQCVGSRFPLRYEGARTREGLWDDKKFVYQAMVKVGQSRVPRTRPIFPDWSCDVEFAFDPDGANRDDILRWMTDGGNFEGIGDNRLNGFGRFSVAEIAMAAAAK